MSFNPNNDVSFFETRLFPYGVFQNRSIITLQEMFEIKEVLKNMNPLCTLNCTTFEESRLKGLWLGALVCTLSRDAFVEGRQLIRSDSLAQELVQGEFMTETQTRDELNWTELLALNLKLELGR